MPNNFGGPKYICHVHERFELKKNVVGVFINEKQYISLNYVHLSNHSHNLQQ